MYINHLLRFSITFLLPTIVMWVIILVILLKEDRNE
jgi:hypothetical protein